MNTLYTAMTSTREFNYPPGGEQLMSNLDAIGPLEKQLCVTALVKLGVSGDEIKASLTVKTLKKFSLVAERDGLLYLPARPPVSSQKAKIRLFLFLKYATGETLLHRGRHPADISFSSSAVSRLVYEIAFFDDEHITEAAEYVEMRKMSVVVKPIVVLQEKYNEITKEDIKTIFDEKKEIIICAITGGKFVFFEDGKAVKEDE